MAFSAADIQGRWHEPIRPRMIGHWLKGSFTQDTVLTPRSSKMLLGDYPPLSEPVRIKPGLKSGQQHYLEVVLPAYYGPPTPTSSNRWLEDIHESNWHYPWSEPGSVKVSYKRSITLGSQQAFSGPARLLPTPNVTIAMDAAESVNADVAQFAINVYDDQPDRPDLSGANVSIAEVDQFGVSVVTILADDQ